MQGAEINETQSGNFGTINNYNAAGFYELQIVCSVNGSSVFFNYPFNHPYNPSGKVQLVKVPEYSNGAKLTGIVTGDSWDGNKGGVLAIKSNGSLDLDQYSIDMTGKGFRGGDALESGGGCVFISPTTYHSSRTSANDRSVKGEGIAAYINGKECSRGPQANGGGGGNNHNGGGSGGANYGAGGAGGQRIKNSAFACGSLEGLNSKSLATEITNGRVFMGGGGGSGHGNNAGIVGESGENGGGIILIITPEIKGTNRSGIYTNGNTGRTNSEGEGGGGGGAGGSIILDVNSISSTLTLSAAGGNGVFVDNIGTSNCSGPGGGGGGGVIAFPPNATYSSAIINTRGGLAGEIASSSQNGCNIGDKNGGADGTNGATITSLSLADNTLDKVLLDTVSACNSYTSPSGKYVWTTSGTYQDTALNAGGCSVIKNIDLKVTSIDSTVSVTGYTTSLGNEFPNKWKSNQNNAIYQWINCDSLNREPKDTLQEFEPKIAEFGEYAVIVRKDGCVDTSDCVLYFVSSIDEEKGNLNDFIIAPNPSNGEFNIISKTMFIKSFSIFDLTGKLMTKSVFQGTKSTEIKLDTEGVYLLKVETDKGIIQRKIVVTH